MNLTDRLTTSNDAVVRHVGGETVVLDLASGTYFGLDPVGTRVWQLIEDQECALLDVCETILGEYDVSRAEVEADVIALAQDLVAHKLASVAA